MIYYAPKEHNPPNIHVVYQEDEAAFLIGTIELMHGKIPKRQQRFLKRGWKSTKRSY